MRLLISFKQELETASNVSDIYIYIYIYICIHSKGNIK